jgi:hypothetical protein
MALRGAAGVWLYTGNDNDFTKRFPLIVAAVAALRYKSVRTIRPRIDLRVERFSKV